VSMSRTSTGQQTVSACKCLCFHDTLEQFTVVSIIKVLNDFWACKLNGLLFESLTTVMDLSMCSIFERYNTVCNCSKKMNALL